MSKPDATLPEAGSRRSGFTLRLDSGRVFVEAVKGPQATLGPVAIEELSMEVPDVSFPFDVSGGAERFRSRRCRLHRLQMRVDAGTLAAALRGALPPEGLLTSIELDARDGFLELTAQVRSAPGAVACARLVLEPDGPFVRAVLCDVRLHGGAPLPAAAVEAEILGLAAAAGGGLREPGAVRLAPLELVVRRYLPARGFKAPDVSDAGVSAITVTPRGLAVTFEDGVAAPPVSTDADALATVEGARAFADAEARMAAGDLAGARAAYLAVAEGPSTHPFAAARLLSLLLLDPSAHDEALDLCALWADRTPPLAASRWVKARILEARGDGAGAARALLELAEIARDGGRRTAAILAAEDAGRAALETDPELSVRALSLSLALRRDRLPSLRLMAVAAERAGDREALLAACRKLAAYGEDDGEVARAHLTLARAAAGAEARLHLEQALRRTPDDREALEALASVCRAAKEPARAARALARAAELAREAGDHPSAGRLSLQLGELWELDLGHDENASLRYREAAAELSGQPAPLRAAARLAQKLGRASEAAEHLAALAAVLPASEGPELARVHRQLARLASEQGDDRAAARHLTACLAQGDELEPLLALAEILRRQEGGSRLADVLGRAAALAEGARKAELLAEAGALHLSAGAPAHAVEALTEALALDPERTPALEALAEAHEALGDVDALLPVLERLRDRELAPKARAAVLRRLALSEADPAAALRDARAAAELAPEDARVLEALVHCERAGGEELLPALARYAAAVVATEPVAAARALAERGELLAAAGQGPAATADLERALDLEPPDPALLEKIGTLLLAASAPERARSALRRAGLAEGGTLRPELALQLGRAALALGDDEDAALVLLPVLQQVASDAGLAENLDGALARLSREAPRAVLLEMRARVTADGPAAAALLARAAELHDAQQLLAPAAACLGAAVALAPEHADAAAWLGRQARLLSLLGDHAGAGEALIARASRLGSPREAARELLQASRGDPALRARALDLAVERDPSFAPARVARARAGGSPGAVLADLGAALAVPASDPDALPSSERAALHREAADAARDCGDTAAERHHLTLVLAHDPSDAGAAESLTHLARESGDPDALCELLAHRAELAGPEAGLPLLLEAAHVARTAGRGAAARDLLERARAWRPHHAPTLLALAPLLEDFPAKLAAVLADLAGVTADAAEAASLRLREARARAAAGDREGARLAAETAASLGGDGAEALDLLLELAGDDPALRALALGRRAAVAVRDGEPDVARRLADHALALDLAGDAEGAGRVRRRAITSDPPPELEVLLRRALADQAAHERRPADAAVELAGLEPLLPPRERVEVARRRATLLVEAGDLAGARRALEDALALAPRDLELLEHAVALAVRTGDAAAEAEGLDGLIAAGARQPEQLALRLAELCEGPLALPGRAEAALRRVLALVPGHPVATARLAALLLARGGDPAREGIALRRAAAAELPGLAGAAELLELSALARTVLGDEGLELDLMRQAGAAAPDRFEATAPLARALVLRGSLDEAHGVLRRAVALERGEAPDLRRELLRLLADVASARGDRAEAEEALGELLQDRPWDEGAARELAALVAPRDPARARQVLATAAFALEDGERRRLLQEELAVAALETSDASAAERHLADLRRLAADPLEADLEHAELARRFGQPALCAAALERAAPELVRAGRLPEASQAWAQMARAAREAGLRDAAVRALEARESLLTASGDDPGAAACARERAELLAGRGERELAEAAFARALELDPGDVRSLHASAELARARGDSAAEATRLEALIALVDDDPARARLLLRLAELFLGPLADGPRGEHALLAALAADEHLDAADAMLEAHLERHARHADLAEHLLHRASSMPRDQAAPLLSRSAELLHGAGRLDEAASAAAAAADAVSSDPVLARRAAELLEAAGRTAEARERLVVALERRPEDGDLAARLSSLLERVGDLAGVAALAEERAVLEPRGHRTAAFLAAAAAHVRAGDAAAAHRCEDAAFEDDPADGAAFARVLGRSTDLDHTANLLLRRARAVPSEAAGLHRARGELLARDGREREAISALDEALSLASEDLAALAARAELVCRLDGEEAAAPTDRRIVALAERGVEGAAEPASRARYRLALTAADLGAPDAEELLEEALRASPGHPRAGHALLALEALLARRGAGPRLHAVRLLLAARAPQKATRVRWLEGAAEAAPDHEARLAVLRDLVTEEPAARRRLVDALRTGEGAAPELARELETFAGEREGVERAHLLLEAAALHEDRLQDPGAAARLRERARETSPGDPAVLRALLPVLRAGGEQGSLAGALAALAERTQDPAEREQALLERARELTTAGDPGAVSAWRDVIALGPQTAAFPAACSEARRLLEEAGRSLEAAELLEMQADSTPAEARAPLLLAAARLLSLSGEAERASRALEAAAAVAPAAPAPWAALAALREAGGDRHGAAEALREEMARLADPGERAERGRRRAALLEEAGDASGALTAYRAVIDDRPDDLTARRVLAAAAQVAGDEEEELLHVHALLASRAELEASEARELERRLAHLCAQHGRTAEAATLYDAIFHDDPGEDEAYHFLRSHLASRKAWAELLELLEARDRGLAARGESAGERRDLRLERARVLAFELGRAAPAEAAYRAVLELDPRNRAALAALRELAERRGDHAAAVNTLEEELASSPPPASAAALLLRLGRIREQHLFDAAAAMASFAAAAELARAPGGPAHLLPEAERGLARTSLAAGDPAAALAALESRFRDAEDAADPRLRAVAADAHLALGDPAAAAEHLRAGLEAAPGDESLLAKLESAARSEGPAAVAAALLRRASSTEDPEQKAEALLRLALVRERDLDDRAGAERALRMVLEIDPAHDGAFEHLRDLLAAASRHGELLELLRRRARKAIRPADRAAALLAMGQIHRGPLPDPRRAADALERALAVEPSLTEAAQLLAAAYVELGRDTDAEPLLRRVIEAGAGPATLVLLGGVLERGGRGEEALAAYAGAGAREALARVAVELGRVEEALAALRVEIATRAGAEPLVLAELHRRIGALERRLLRGDEAVRSFEAAVALDPSDHASARQLATLYEAQGDARRCEAALRTLVSRLPPGAARADALVELGELRMNRLADVPGAIGAFENARADRPRHPGALRRLVELYATSGRGEELTACAEELRALGDEAAVEPYLVELARARRALGDDAGALALLERALVLSPTDPDLRTEVRDLAWSQGQMRTFAEQERWLAERDAVHAPQESAERLRALAQLSLDRFSDREEAVALLERAAALWPESDEQALLLLQLLARAPETAPRALAGLASRARVRLTDGDLLRTLAAACGAAGDLERSRVTASLADAWAGTAGNPGPQPADVAGARVGEELLSRVAHPDAARALPRLLRALAPALEPLFPSDLDRHGAAPADAASRTHFPEVAAEVAALAACLTDRPLATLIAPGRGVELHVENTRPASLVVGEGALSSVSPAARRFLLARGIALASSGWALVGKFPAPDLRVLCSITCRVFDRTVPVPGLPEDRVEPYVQAVLRAVSGAHRELLRALAAAAREELAALDPRALALGIACTASRVALLVCGSPAGAVEGLRALEKMGGLSPEAAVRASPELADLAAFVLRDDWSRLRSTAGLHDVAAPAGRN